MFFPLDLIKSSRVDILEIFGRGILVMLGKTEGKRRGWQWMRWFESISDSTNMNMSKLWEIVKDREAWPAAMHGIAKNHHQSGLHSHFAHHISSEEGCSGDLYTEIPQKVCMSSTLQITVIANNSSTTIWPKTAAMPRLGNPNGEQWQMCDNGWIYNLQCPPFLPRSVM